MMTIMWRKIVNNLILCMGFMALAAIIVIQTT